MAAVASGLSTAEQQALTLYFEGDPQDDGIALESWVIEQFEYFRRLLAGGFSESQNGTARLSCRRAIYETFLKIARGIWRPAAVDLATQMEVLRFADMVSASSVVKQLCESIRSDYLDDGEVKDGQQRSEGARDSAVVVLCELVDLLTPNIDNAPSDNSSSSPSRQPGAQLAPQAPDGDPHCFPSIWLQMPCVVAVVGATGAVGEEMVQVLYDRRFPLTKLVLLASERSAGKKVATPYGDMEVGPFSVEAAQNCDVVLMAVSGSFSLEFSPQIVANGKSMVIDNSSAFRYHEDIPLVVPEINSLAMKGKLLIANPNCTTAIAAMALWPLHQRFTLRKVIVSTYQAASGAGAAGMAELDEGTRRQLAGEVVTPKVFAHPLPFNVIPHIDSFQDNGYTKEEMKVVWETQKIFGSTDIACSCTAVRIPTRRAHSEAITIETADEITADAARQVLREAPGIDLVDSPAEKKYPMPLTAASKYNVEVGRIRSSLVFQPRGVDLFVSGDQLLRGAALNAVLIAEAKLEEQRMARKRPVDESPVA